MAILKVARLGHPVLRQKAREAAVAVREERVAVDDVGAGAIALADEGRESVRQVELVGVQPRDPPAAGPGNGPVQRVRLALVRLRDPVDEVVELLEQLDGTVGRAAVLDHMLDGDAGLLGNALDRIAEVVRVPVGGRHHGQVEGLGRRRLSLHCQLSVAAGRMGEARQPGG